MEIEILQINDKYNAVSKRFDAINAEIDSCRAKLEDILAAVSSANAKLSAIETEKNTINERIAEIETKGSEISKRLQESEGEEGDLLGKYDNLRKEKESLEIKVSTEQLAQAFKKAVCILKNKKTGCKPAHHTL